MARQLRVDFPGARHHVMNRGLRHQVIFHGDADAIAFLALLEELPLRFGVEVHGYALMPNHYHLMVRSVDGNLAETMRWLGLMWTQRLNRRHPEWDGPVFRGRYKSCVVDSEHYWGHLLAYLHLNPVRGRIAMSPDQADWTSHRAYLGESRVPWLTTGELRAWYGTARSYAAYLEDVQRGLLGHPEGFERVVDWGIKGEVVGPPSRERTRLPRPEVEGLVSSILGREWDEVPTRSGRLGNPEAAFGCWALHRVAGVSQAELAAELGVSRSAVQQRVRRVEARRHRDPSLWRLIAAFDARLPDRTAQRLR